MSALSKVTEHLQFRKRPHLDNRVQKHASKTLKSYILGIPRFYRPPPLVFQIAETCAMFPTDVHFTSNTVATSSDGSTDDFANSLPTDPNDMPGQPLSADPVDSADYAEKASQHSDALRGSGGSGVTKTPKLMMMPSPDIIPTGDDFDESKNMDLGCGEF